MPPTGTPRSTDATPPRKPSSMLTGLLLLGSVFAVLIFGYRLILPQSMSISYDKFDGLIQRGLIQKISIIGNAKVTGEVRNREDPYVVEMKLIEGRFNTTLPLSDNLEPFLRLIRDKDAEAATKAGEPARPPVQISIDEDQSAWYGPLFWNLLVIGLFMGVFFVFMLPRMRDPMGGSYGTFTRSPARKYEKVATSTSFDDVAGMQNAKKELVEVVEFLKNPEKFTRLGAQIPKGVLLVGPPGTGKTLLARAVAGEAGVPFYSVNGSEFIQMFVGVGATRVRDLFRTAKETSPCVIFIDEIDAVGRMRGTGMGGGSDEREQTLNQILSEMDGFQPVETIIVIAATNRPDVLDSALLRPGRFDRQITVDRQTWQGRLEILKVHTRNKPLADDVNLERVARQAIGMSGAELRNLANEAAILAAREDKQRIDKSDFDHAHERVLIGLRHDHPHTETERRRTAVHEAGHALCSLHQVGSEPLWKVSILARGMSAGVTMMMPNEDLIDYSQSRLFAQLVMTMGGRAADQIEFGVVSSGASQDLKQATRTARAMVTQFGMSDRLGPVAYRAGEEHVFLGRDIHESRDFSEGTARIIDEEVQRLLREANDRAMEIITQNRGQLDKLVAELLKEEELDREQVENLLGFHTKEVPSEPDTTMPA